MRTAVGTQCPQKQRASFDGGDAGLWVAPWIVRAKEQAGGTAKREEITPTLSGLGEVQGKGTVWQSWSTKGRRNGEVSLTQRGPGCQPPPA